MSINDNGTNIIGNEGSAMRLVILLGIISRISGSIVDTEYGQVSGHYINVNNGRDPTMPIEVFHNIPFAKDTSGSLRFAKPEPRDPWTGVLNATALGPACVQRVGGLVMSFTHPGWDYYSEDCLHLSIYTKDVAGGPFPVMLWFHGGGYTSGANIQYPGHFLATRDVVVVVANYRLGEFGFLYCGSDTCPGNYGMWDQNMALQFVVDNIANFGGDPNLITVFGESAGAGSTALQMVSPHSKDLFQQAIMESGSSFVPWALSLNPENKTDDLADSLGCLGADDAESLDCLRTLSWQHIQENGTCVGCGLPVVDGPGGFIPDSPEELRKQGSVMSGPLLAGINHDEGSLFIIALVPEVLLGCCNRSYYERMLEKRFVGLILGDYDNVTQADTTKALDYNYSPWPNIYDKYKNRDSLERIVTDLMFGYGWDKEVKLHQDIAPTWSYLYNFRGRNATMLFPEWMGIPHIAEIPYTWGYTLLPFNQEVIDDSQIQFDLIDWTEEDISHTLFAMDLWTNFAKFGNPTPTPVDNPLGGTTVWPQFTWDDMNVLEIKNTSIDVIQNYQQQDYAFWTEYIPYLVVDLSPGPYFPEFGVIEEMTEGWEDALALMIEAKMDGLDLETLDDF